VVDMPLGKSCMMLHLYTGFMQITQGGMAATSEFVHSEGRGCLGQGMQHAMDGEGGEGSGR